MYDYGLGCLSDIFYHPVPPYAPFSFVAMYVVDHFGADSKFFEIFAQQSMFRRYFSPCERFALIAV